MNTKPHAYKGEQVTVTYDLARCIHAAECVRGLPEVFDPERKPWVQPDNADPGELLQVVDRCPTGALSATRNDGTAEASATSGNTVTVEPDGPLYVRGELRIKLGGEERTEGRAALCRCGASKNKPYCDGSHAEAGFSDNGALGEFNPQDPVDAGPVEIKPVKNGPVLTAGSLDIFGAGLAEPVRCDRAALCRCGASKNKPFCDGSHKEAGFQAD